MHDGRLVWRWYLLGGLGLLLVVTGAVEAALIIWQGVFLVSVPFMVLSASGWFLYKYAELSATSGDSGARDLTAEFAGWGAPSGVAVSWTRHGPVEVIPGSSRTWLPHAAGPCPVGIVRRCFHL